MKKIILCAALTGAMVTKEKNENIPLHEDEIINSAYECYRAGAAIVHLHVRDQWGKPSLSFDKYNYIIREIRKRCNVLICISTSNFGVNIKNQERYNLYDLDTDLASLAFGNLYRENGSITNDKEFIMNSIKIMEKKNICPEIEIFNEKMFFDLLEFYEKNFLYRPPYVQYVFGSPGGMSATYENIIKFINLTPQDWYWSAVGVGKMQLSTNLITMMSGATVARTGLEDNVYFLKDVKAYSNAQFINRLVKISNDIGMQVASPEEARGILNINKRYDRYD